MPDVSVGGLAASLQRAVEAQGRVVQAAQDEAERSKAARDAEPSDQAETEAQADEAEE